MLGSDSALREELLASIGLGSQQVLHIGFTGGSNGYKSHAMTKKKKIRTSTCKRILHTEAS
jgi:hypothetical protein